MSGIAGVASSNESALVLDMLDKINHRGTSKPSVWQGPGLCLGAIGLNALQEEPGPVRIPGTERAIVMDGAISNPTSLEDDLAQHVNSDSAPEANPVMQLFEEYGTSFLGKVDGKFALAIVDGDRYLLARDPLGVRPLYYGFRKGALCFASEIKALRGIVDEAHEFPPGHFLISGQGLFPYSGYRPQSIALDGALDSAERLSELLAASVGRVIPCKVRVGVWLSGGVDSSVVAALARQYVDHLYTFSAGMEGAPDLEYARFVAKHIESEHFERIFDLDEALKILEMVIYQLESFDAPLVRSSIANFLVAERAADHVPFALSGEGGDELFAGYAYQRSCNGELELTLSVQDAIAALHNTALQRVDRSAAANGIRAGLPFLTANMVRYALAIPARWKIRGEQQVDKWPLRRGLAHVLPDIVAWRAKSKFWQGTGLADLLAQHAEEKISDDAFLAEREPVEGISLRSKEELMYFRIFHSFFGDVVPLTEVGRTQHV